MRLVLMLSLRNLFRQKRRNFFLGIAICFGMMILVLATSFSHGLSDTLLNRVVVYMFGHVSVTGMEDSSRNRRIIRDKERFVKIIKANIKDLKDVRESVGVFARVIGNSRGDNAWIAGSAVTKEFTEYLGQNFMEGNLADFTGGKLENPVVLYSEKAKLLGVKHLDTVNARFRTITGQEQSVRLTVAGIMRSSNMFEGMAMFVHLKDLKPLLGLRPYETSQLQVNFKRINDPALAIREADRLHGLLKPGIAVIWGSASQKKKSVEATALGFSVEGNAPALMRKHVSVIAGKAPDEKSSDGALISKSLAAALGLKPGDFFTYRYNNKFENIPVENRYRVSGIFKSDSMPGTGIILMNEKTFYKTYLENLPDEVKNNKNAFMPDKKSPLFKLFAPEWKLLARSSTFDEMQLKLRDMTKTKWKGAWINVLTMYESADFILKLEFALNLVAFIAVVILFFIILIGVLNTLRMTIRERTREIGTVRAIGMQKSDVKYLFIAETVLLTAIACVIGILLSFIAMWILGLFTINTDSVLSILLVKRHLYFYPSAFSIARNFIIILLMAAVTAYFPARRASNLSAVEALRHFE
jgi:ABC-type lipoprotein release transport system permease subunit